MTAYLKAIGCENETGDYHQGHLARDCYWPIPWKPCTAVHTRRYNVGPLAGKLQRGVTCEDRGDGLDNLCNNLPVMTYRS